MAIDTSTFDHITREILGAAIEVHRHLGAGLLESTYVPCFQFELKERRLNVPRLMDGVKRLLNPRAQLDA